MSSTPMPLAAPADVEKLAELIRGRRTVALAGAGCSTESGIPDYRGPQGRMHTRKPVQYGDFVRSEAVRRRYWARATVGWQRVGGASPNDAHRALADMEGKGALVGVITQNVDGLHQAAGSSRVVELHGSLAHVVCLSCGGRLRRSEMQERLGDLNRGWLEDLSGLSAEDRPRSAPDGDADLPDDAYADFVVPPCDACEGMLKPDVVFFGENVPKERVGVCWSMLDESDVLLVVGSSLTVYSGRRFVYGAADRSMPVGVVNWGPTRADEVAAVKVEARLGDALSKLSVLLD